MKEFVLFSVLMCVLFTGCSGGETIEVSPEDDPPTVVVPPSEPVTPAANLIDMHNGCLKGVGFQKDESGGFVAFNVSVSATEGDASIEMESTAGLIVGQLIAYESWNGEVYASVVDSFTDTIIFLQEPLAADIYAGNHLSNFYYNSNHPHSQGYRAIADYALRRYYGNAIDFGTHVLLGDSWFSNNCIATRFSDRFQSALFINKGVAGDTVSKLLERFDADVVPENPDFVWVMVGTNDYWQGVDAAEYLSGIQQVIDRVEAIGATAIVFDPSVGPFESLEYGIHLNGELKLRSDEYAEVVKALSFSKKLDLRGTI